MEDNPYPIPFPRIGLSQGDFNGISYELMLKTFADARMFETLTPVLYGQSKAFSYYKKNFGMESPNYSLTRDARQGGVLDALVMAPDSPLVAQSNRDFLLSFHKESNPLQVLVNGQMRIALATGDLPLRAALDQIDAPFLVGKLTTLSQALKTDFGISSPKIAVMGINPHSGSIVAGDDEKVAKALTEAQDKGLFAFGPFSASQLFAAGLWKKYDAVMAMHYEQGVFPMKFISLDGYAYYWAGLPVVCAAPLHGPAYDITNQNKAVPDSYRKAVFLMPW